MLVIYGININEIYFIRIFYSRFEVHNFPPNFAKNCHYFKNWIVTKKKNYRFERNFMLFFYLLEELTYKTNISQRLMFRLLD